MPDANSFFKIITRKIDIVYINWFDLNKNLGAIWVLKT